MNCFTSGKAPSFHWQTSSLAERYAPAAAATSSAQHARQSEWSSTSFTIASSFAQLEQRSACRRRAGRRRRPRRKTRVEGERWWDGGGSDGEDDATMAATTTRARE
jgi:hypothetical protein